MDAPAREPDRARLRLTTATVPTVRYDPQTARVETVIDRVHGVFILDLPPARARELAERLYLAVGEWGAAGQPQRP